MTSDGANMLDKNNQASPSTTWFVGASYGTDDQMPRFLEEGIWENGYDDRHLEHVRSMQPGERIPSNPSYHLHRDDLDGPALFFHRTSYLCKSATKVFVDGSHGFGCSRS
jgi:hypothetical protein